MQTMSVSIKFLEQLTEVLVTQQPTVNKAIIIETADWLCGYNVRYVSVYLKHAFLSAIIDMNTFFSKTTSQQKYNISRTNLFPNISGGLITEYCAFSSTLLHHHNI